MNCICGCGIELDRNQIELNLLAGEVAIELVVWDKARELGSSIAADEVAALLAAGAPRYQDLLAAIHAKEQPEKGDLGKTQEWLADSRAARLRLHGDLPVPKKKISLSAAEHARIDRRHPERSFSAEAESTSESTSELEAILVTALADVRAGRPEEAKRTLQRFLSEGS